MEIVTILRELWRLRILVVLAAVVAIAVGWTLAFEPPLKSRSYTVGVGNARIFLDT